MNFTFISLLILAMVAIRIFERTLFHVYKWQLKEYRWDRYRDYLNSRQGIWMLLHPWYWLGVLLLFFIFFYEFIFVPFPDSLKGTALFVYGSALYFFISALVVIVRLFQHRLQRPQWTTRAILSILVSVLLMVLFLFSFARFHWWNLQLPVLLATPLIVALSIFFTSFPANYFKSRTIEKAKQKMASLPNVKVIGITGSYGKSSTKEFLATILSTKYKVVKTSKNNNSEIGVAQTVLRDVKPEHEVFIVEMGAYRRGEIKAICDIVHPTIGVLTAVSEQHLSLFGSFDNIKKTKYELIEALPEDGMAIFNADNRAMRELAEQTLKPKKLYSTERPSDVSASAMTVQSERFSFNLITEDGPLESRGPSSSHRIEANLLGGQQIANLLAAITVAYTLGMTLEEVAEAVKNITPLDHTLKPYHHPSGALIIDDTYSANPDGVVAALNHLKCIPRKYKVLVMMPMIELGSAAKDAHRRVGEHIGEVCDLAVMTQKNFFNIMRKASKLPKEKILVLSGSQSILNALTPYLNENSVVLLENRVPASVVTALCVR